MRTLVALLLLAPMAAAQVPGIDDAITDGVAFELDDEATVSRMTALADSVSGQVIHDCIAEITTDIPYSYRVMGTPTYDLFLEKYANVFGELGLATALQPFDKGAAGMGIGTVFGEGGTNIVGVLPGANPDKWVVIGGHYDTRELTFGGGALDNTSGICTVLEIAKAMLADTMANGPYDASVVFNWYDGEEWGLYGSVAFAEDPTVAKTLLGLAEDAPADILVSQSFDMVGLNYPAYNTWIQYGEQGEILDEFAVLNLRTAPIHADNGWACWSYGCYEELKERDTFNTTLVNFTNYQFLVREIAYDLFGYAPEHIWIWDDSYGRSDHIPLIAKGAAGMRIQGSHDGEYPGYHQPWDTLQELYVLAGGQDRFIMGLDTQADIGALTAMYTALQGDHGHYGEVLFLGVDPNQFTGNGTETPDAVDDVDAPFPAVALLAIALLLVVARRR